MTKDEIKEIGDFIDEMEALHARLDNNPIMWRPWRPEEIMLEKLFYDYLTQKKRITKAIDKLHCWGEVLDPEFQQEMLKILEGDNDEKREDKND